jgi:hypothetical protein
MLGAKVSEDPEEEANLEAAAERPADARPADLVLAEPFFADFSSNWEEQRMLHFWMVLDKLRDAGAVKANATLVPGRARLVSWKMFTSPLRLDAKSECFRLGRLCSANCCFRSDNPPPLRYVFRIDACFSCVPIVGCDAREFHVRCFEKYDSALSQRAAPGLKTLSFDLMNTHLLQDASAVVWLNYTTAKFRK